MDLSVLSYIISVKKAIHILTGKALVCRGVGWESLYKVNKPGIDGYHTIFGAYLKYERHIPFPTSGETERCVIKMRDKKKPIKDFNELPGKRTQFI